MADGLKTAVTEVLQENGVVYDENSGLYYDYDSGYYFDAVSMFCDYWKNSSPAATIYIYQLFLALYKIPIKRISFIQ